MSMTTGKKHSAWQKLVNHLGYIILWLLAASRSHITDLHASNKRPNIMNSASITHSIAVKANLVATFNIQEELYA